MFRRYHIQNATAPTIMFHGIDDPRMPLSQSFQLHYALKQRGAFLTLPLALSLLPPTPSSSLFPFDASKQLRCAYVAKVLHRMVSLTSLSRSVCVCVCVCVCVNPPSPMAVGIPVRFVAFPGSGHIPSDPVQIKTVWDESLDWMETHMPVAARISV